VDGDLAQAQRGERSAHVGQGQNVVVGRPDGPIHARELGVDQKAAGGQQAHDFGEHLRLVVHVVQHVDHEQAVGDPVGERRPAALSQDDVDPPGGGVRGELVAQPVEQHLLLVDRDEQAVRKRVGDGE